MPQIRVELGNFETGGYSYILYRNGLGVKSVTNAGNLNTTWNAIRDDIAALLGTENVTQVTINVSTVSS